ncbi:MAG: hypothetical protein AABX08_03430 [Nanoarchaeota archaeon]
MGNGYGEFKNDVNKYRQSVRGFGDRMGLSAQLSERTASLCCGDGNYRQEVQLPSNVSNALALLKRQGFRVVTLDSKLDS